jgi:hypothetical protein
LAASSIAERHELRLGRVNAQAASGHPIGHDLKVGGDEVSGARMVPRNGNKSAIVYVKLCSAVGPTLCQAKEGTGVERRQDGGEGGALRCAIMHGVGQAKETIKM